MNSEVDDFNSVDGWHDYRVCSYKVEGKTTCANKTSTTKINCRNVSRASSTGNMSSRRFNGSINPGDQQRISENGIEGN